MEFSSFSHRSRGGLSETQIDHVISLLEMIHGSPCLWIEFQGSAHNYLSNLISTDTCLIIKPQWVFSLPQVSHILPSIQTYTHTLPLLPEVPHTILLHSYTNWLTCRVFVSLSLATVIYNLFSCNVLILTLRWHHMAYFWVHSRFLRSLFIYLCHFIDLCSPWHSGVIWVWKT